MDGAAIERAGVEHAPGGGEADRDVVRTERPVAGDHHPQRPGVAAVRCHIDRGEASTQRRRGECGPDHVEDVLRVDREIGFAVLTRIAAQRIRRHVHDTDHDAPPAARMASSD